MNLRPPFGALLLAAVLFSMEVTQTQTRKESHRLMEDSLAEAFKNAIANVTTPELEARKEELRAVQRRGYTNVLMDVIAGDGLGSLISFLKVKLQIEISLPHDVLVLRVPITQPPTEESPLFQLYTFSSGPFSIPLREDWTFPRDPWER